MTITPVSMTPTPTVREQVDRLIEAGLPAAAGISAEELRSLASGLRAGPDSILVVHPRLAAASALAPLLSRNGKPGFVVGDMSDVDEFTAIDGIDLPDRPLYLIHAIDRGDDMSNWSPAEALPEITARGRRPLTVHEGLSWLLQQPEQLQPGRCFMTIGSRLIRDGALDARTPAIWISGGTGRDGRARRGAPKLGWCWARNRHTWLGFASTPR
ncbi:DUF5701 family protein [Herbiconiux sp. UC225_62]|uniref:DUF5701 family protein n=1 Tax=Herbiconiux sp. UC225_62 TaxID=3350168 RepID=UPI0036D36189